MEVDTLQIPKPPRRRVFTERRTSCSEADVRLEAEKKKKGIKKEKMKRRKERKSLENKDKERQEKKRKQVNLKTDEAAASFLGWIHER